MKKMCDKTNFFKQKNLTVRKLKEEKNLALKKNVDEKFSNDTFLVMENFWDNFHFMTTPTLKKKKCNKTNFFKKNQKVTKPNKNIKFFQNSETQIVTKLKL